MLPVSRLGRFLIRNINSSLRASVRHYDPETGGAEFKSTTLTMLSKEDDDYLYVEAYSQMGFLLSNGFRLVGPCVLFPRSILHWGIAGAHELNAESLSLFPLLEPKLDILILGIGDHGAKYDKGVFSFLRANKINVEILPTDQACATFNFLNAERRMVAAALIPPTYMQIANDEDLQFRAQLESEDNIFEMKRGFGEDPSADVPGELAPLLDNLHDKLGIGQKGKTAPSVKRGENDDPKEKTGQGKGDKGSDSSSDNKGRL